MSFKKGDRVRIIEGNDWQPHLKEHVGKVVTVERSGGAWFMPDAWLGDGGIWNANAELVSDKTLDEQIAEAKAEVARLEAVKKLQDVHKFHTAPLGSFAVSPDDFEHQSRYVKVAPNSWVLISNVERNDHSKTFRDRDLARMKATVKK